MLLAIDIGNSNIVIGGIEHDQIRFEARIATDHIKTSAPLPGGGLHHLLGGASGVQLCAHRTCQADWPYPYGGGARH